MKFNIFEDHEYLPIEHYGVIGNLETVALVGMNGSIDFMCFPAFDSPSIFARLLDRKKGGYFQIAPAEKDMTCKQMYLPDTNILVTRFLSREGILEVVDFMPLFEGCSGNKLVRIVKSIQGDIKVVMKCFPAFDYARATMKAELDETCDSVSFSCDNDEITTARLHSEISLHTQDNGAITEFTLQEDERVIFTYVCDVCEEKDGKDFGHNMVDKALEKTTCHWRDWLAQSGYDGFWRDQVNRSALVLKLLFSKKHGSIVAAPTFSLPETTGGTRNWDYRYCWIRDSAFTVYVLLKLGFTEETTRYIDWIAERYSHCKEDGSLQLMYRLDGGSDIEEKILDHLEGYKKSAPVRIGNAAQEQLQLDIYGELIDSIYLAHKYSAPMAYEGWQNLTQTIEYVCENWNRPDEGIWEFRGGKKHFLHSRLMCWVAIARAVRLSEKGSFPAPLDHWLKVRDEIYHDIHNNFWNKEIKAFVQYKGADTMDASVLLMPLVKFISPVDPRWQSTMKEVKKQLVTDAFVKRYTAQPEFEGLDGSEEGNFTMCSFWYCECLARGGDVNEARLLFEKMIGYANHLGLYSEELGFEGQHLGNFPQAFTHLALISAASAIERATENGGQPF